MKVLETYPDCFQRDPKAARKRLEKLPEGAAHPSNVRRLKTAGSRIAEAGLPGRHDQRSRHEQARGEKIGLPLNAVSGLTLTADNRWF